MLVARVWPEDTVVTGLGGGLTVTSSDAAVGGLGGELVDVTGTKSGPKITHIVHYL